MTRSTPVGGGARDKQAGAVCSGHSFRWRPIFVIADVPGRIDEDTLRDIKVSIFPSGLLDGEVIHLDDVRLLRIGT